MLACASHVAQTRAIAVEVEQRSSHAGRRYTVEKDPSAGAFVRDDLSQKPNPKPSPSNPTDADHPEVFTRQRSVSWRQSSASRGGSCCREQGGTGHCAAGVGDSELCPACERTQALAASSNAGMRARSSGGAKLCLLSFSPCSFRTTVMWCRSEWEGRGVAGGGSDAGWRPEDRRRGQRWSLPGMRRRLRQPVGKRRCRRDGGP